MKSPFDDTPEDLAALRSSVDDWLEKAQAAVWSFHVPRDHSFMRDSGVDQGRTSLTTTARCYMALAYATRERKEYRDAPEGGWQQCAQSFIRGLRLTVVDQREVREPKTKRSKSFKALNNFEFAHLSDFIFLRKFCERFQDDARNNGIDLNWPDDFKGGLDAVLEKRLKENLSSSRPRSDNHAKANISRGETFFDEGKKASKHFFVTLHTLRAHAILEPGEDLPAGTIDDLVSHARQFCFEQCFHGHRGTRHAQDPAGLAFAGVILCMYGAEVDNELICAFVETLAKFQQESGAWPTTHPIIRKDKDPWYIASHEIPLCLTWLYFQPLIPDTARAMLLAMMERYFKKWLIPTHRRAEDAKGKKFSGWYDDSAAGQEEVVGWASSIVCHFLANYRTVLNDHINRRVIESLNLQAPSKRYLIDATAHDLNPRWGVSGLGKTSWPDLPPIAWVTAEEAEPELLGKSISWNWTDPTEHSRLSMGLAKEVLAPILNSHQQKPQKFVSGIFDGPPGTRKTSLMKAISKRMRWPYIPVPASVIFENGFDLMEARATEVFRRLNYLTQCVIFFDEFEEFFRKRPKEKIPKVFKAAEVGGVDDKESECFAGIATIHDRTIAAFTTPAMLPRLQELRDQKSCLIFLATNHLDKIDDAIIRPGRFDFKESINHPLLSKRFLARSGKSYFDSITERTLQEIGVQVDKETMKPKKGANGSVRLMKIVNAAKKALSKANVKEAFKNRRVQEAFGNSIAKNDTNKPGMDKEDKNDLDDDLAWVRFTFVEELLNSIAKHLDSEEIKPSPSQLESFADAEVKKKLEGLEESNQPVSLISS